MTYIVQRKDRFHVFAFDGLDPLTGRERRRWHPVGHDRHEAEVVAARSTVTTSAQQRHEVVPFTSASS